MPPVADAGTDVRGIDQVRQRAAASAKAAPARPSSADRSLLRSAGPRPKTPVLGFGSSAARPVTANVGTPQRDAPPKSPYLAHSALKKPSSILDTPSAARNVSTPGTNARPSSAPRRATDSSVLPRRAASPTVQPRRASSPSVPARRLPQVSSTPPRVFEQLLTAKPPVPQLRLTSTPSAPAATSTAAALARTSSAPPSVPAVPKLNLSSVILPDDGPAPDQHKLLCPSSQQQQQQHVGAAPSSAASSLDPSPQRKAAAASSVAAGKARPKAKGSSSHAGPKPPTPQPPPPAPVEEDKSSFYLYPTTTPEERKRVEALLKSLPEKQRAEVGRLWSGLCEARQNCEQMAFRGHRMLDQMKNEFARFREDASAQQQALLSDQHSLLEELRAAQAQLARSQQQGVSSGSAGLAAHPTDTMEDGATADEQGGDSRPRRGSVQGWEELCDQWTAREAGCRQDGASANAEILELIQQLRVVGAANAAAADGGVGAAAYAARDSHQAASGHMLIETASDGLLYLPADTPHNA